MRYLLDTNTWIHYLKSVASPVEARLRQIPVGQVVVCSVVRAELLHGARKYERRNERVARIERMLSHFAPCHSMMPQLETTRRSAIRWRPAVK